jgi:hypothetical protein
MKYPILRRAVLHTVKLNFLPSDLVRYIGVDKLYTARKYGGVRHGEEYRVQCIILHDTGTGEFDISEDVQAAYELRFGDEITPYAYRDSAKRVLVKDTEIELIRPRESLFDTPDTDNSQALLTVV